MVKSITLTASMRSNLNSLKNISKQMNTTQERLSTGKKVNSAIDNASSYYQARALTNRASDLDALLDAMGQGIQTIQAATQGLTSGVSFLEQASAIATEALAATKIPTKEWFEAQVGENGAVVTTAQELKDAVNSGKETICVYGKITFEKNENLIALRNQKLVGIGYFGDFDSEINKFSSITGSSDKRYAAMFELVGGEISDLQLNYESTFQSQESNCIQGSGVVKNVDIHFSAKSYNYTAALSGNLTIQGNVNINVQNSFGIFGLDGKFATIDTGACVKITTSGQKATYGKVFIKAGSKVSVETLDFYDHWNAQTGYIEENAQIELNGKFYRVKKAADLNELINASNITEKLDLEEIEPWTTETKREEIDNSSYADQYNKAFEQYDELIKDSSYQGVNLLKKEKLDVVFNETRNNKLTVQGQDMSSAALGLTKASWTTQGDIANSIQELLAAVNKIRTFQSELGNNYSIIQTRQNFTEALTDVLETGADNLVLADMNEESANYLALQTRQQLATNALSLAANSAQSVLALFG